MKKADILLFVTIAVVVSVFLYLILPGDLSRTNVMNAYGNMVAGDSQYVSKQNFKVMQLSGIIQPVTGQSVTTPSLPVNEIIYDESTMTTQDLLEQVMNCQGLSQERKDLIEKAFSLYGKGVIYNQSLRQINNPNPKYMDCSGFMAWCFGQTGIDSKLGQNTTTIYQSSSFSIKEEELLPGDFAYQREGTEYNRTHSPWNHVVMYVCKNTEGKRMYIHCQDYTPAITFNAWSIATIYRRANVLQGK